MSYKRAWMLVETMNAAFSRPLVESVRGGAQGGGARLTPMGEAVLAHAVVVATGATANWLGLENELRLAQMGGGVSACAVSIMDNTFFLLAISSSL